MHAQSIEFTLHMVNRSANAQVTMRILVHVWNLLGDAGWTQHQDYSDSKDNYIWCKVTIVRVG